MKKVLSFLMFVLALSAAISSCKKDNNEEPALITQEKWFLEKATAHTYDMAGAVVDTVTDSTYTENDYFAFQSDNRFEWVTDGEKINGTYKIENSVLYLANQSGSLQASIGQKSASSFIFFWDQISATQKIRITFYYKP